MFLGMMSRCDKEGKRLSAVMVLRRKEACEVRAAVRGSAARRPRVAAGWEHWSSPRMEHGAMTNAGGARTTPVTQPYPCPPPRTPETSVQF